MDTNEKPRIIFRVGDTSAELVDYPIEQMVKTIPKMLVNLNNTVANANAASKAATNPAGG